MAQMNWVYLDRSGGRHRVGLYHGDSSGHVVLYANLRVVQIDFSVKDTRSYSFFIEDELCEVHLVLEKDGRFGYEFKINKDADTPLNRARKVEVRSDRKRIGWVLAALVAFVGLLVGLGWYFREQQANAFRIDRVLSAGVTDLATRQRLTSEGRSAIATVYFVEPRYGERLVFYTFSTADGQKIQSKTHVKTPEGPLLLPTGFELRHRDEFNVRYLPDNPHIHAVDVRSPSESTIRRYVKLAISYETHGDGTQIEKAECRVAVLLEKKSWQVLADVIGQTTEPSQKNPHNRDTYLRLIRQPDVEQALREACWDR
jgi:hypothetical protein